MNLFGYQILSGGLQRGPIQDFWALRINEQDPQIPNFPLEDPSAFPTQIPGLRTFYNAAVVNLCMVALADAPTGMGGRLTIDKNGTLYAVYLVETSDPNASNVRIQTTTGTKSIRLQT